MEEQREFSLYLSSNSDILRYRHNTPGHFKTQLAKELCLSGRWEVGLRQINYLNKFINITDNTVFRMNIGVKCKSTPEEQDTYLFVEFPAGYYKSIALLIYELNSKIRTTLNAFLANNPEVEFTKNRMYDALTEFYDYEPNRPIEYPFFNQHTLSHLIYLRNVEFDLFEIRIKSGFSLWRALGYSDSVRNIKHYVFGSVQPSLTQNLPALFIYSSVVSHSHVGDVGAPLISVVPIKGRTHHYSNETVDSIVYVPVSRKYLRVVDIEILDMIGNRVNFAEGVTTVHLHFRKNGAKRDTGYLL